LLRRVGKLRQSIEISEGLLQIARRHDFKKYTLTLLNSLTLGLTFMEEFGKALEFGFESLELRKANGNAFDIAIALNNLGLLYYKLDDGENAIKLYLECHKIRRGINDSAFHFSELTNIGLAYGHLGKPTIGMKYLDSAMMQDGNSGPELLGLTYGLGYLHQKLGNADSAAIYFSKCLELALNFKDPRFQMEALHGLANLELVRGNLPLCGKYLRDIENIGSTEHKLIRTEIVKVKAKYYAASGEMSKAYVESQKYISEYSSQIMEMNREIRWVQQREMEKENIRKLELQANILNLQNLTLARQRIFAGSVTILLFVLAFLAYKLLKANSQIRSINRLLDERVVERTGELRKHSDLVQHLVDEHRISGNRVASELFSLVGTLKGLLNLCDAETSINSHLCLSKASVVVGKIEEIVARLKSPPEQ
jgi:tetratricopeptide (TPR) repeat protein